MTLTSDQRAVLDRYTIEDLRQQLRYAGPGPGAVVPGLGDNMMSRGDVQAYIFEREHKAARTQRRLPRVSILVTVIGIVVSATVAGLIFVWTNRALLSPTAAGIRGGIGVDQPFSYFVSYGNIGKEPAYGFVAQEDIGTFDSPELFRGLERLGEFRHIDNFDVYEAVRTVRSVSIYFELLREDTAQYFKGRFRRAGKAWTLGYAVERHAGLD